MKQFAIKLKTELDKLGTVISSPKDRFTPTPQKSLQFNISSHGVSKGPGVNLDADEVSLDASITELAKKIHEETNGKCSFGELVLPKTVVSAQSYMADNIFVRGITDIMIETDREAERYDVLVIPS